MECTKIEWRQDSKHWMMPLKTLVHDIAISCQQANWNMFVAIKGWRCFMISYYDFKHPLNARLSQSRKTLVPTKKGQALMNLNSCCSVAWLLGVFRRSLLKYFAACATLNLLFDGISSMKHCYHAVMRIFWILDEIKFNLGNPFIEKNNKKKGNRDQNWNLEIRYMFVGSISTSLSGSLSAHHGGKGRKLIIETTTISFPGLRQTSLLAICDLRVNENMSSFSRLSMYHQCSHMKYSWCFRNPVKTGWCGNYPTFYNRRVRRPTGPDVIRCFIPRIPRPWPRLSLEQVLQNGPKVVPIPQKSKTRLKEKGLTYKRVTEQRRDRFTQSIHLCLHEKWITSKRFKWIKYIRLHQSDSC